VIVLTAAGYTETDHSPRNQVNYCRRMQTVCRVKGGIILSGRGEGSEDFRRKKAVKGGGGGSVAAKTGNLVRKFPKRFHQENNGSGGHHRWGVSVKRVDQLLSTGHGGSRGDIWGCLDGKPRGNPGVNFSLTCGEDCLVRWGSVGEKR